MDLYCRFHSGLARQGKPAKMNLHLVLKQRTLPCLRCSGRSQAVGSHRGHSHARLLPLQSQLAQIFYSRRSCDCSQFAGSWTCRGASYARTHRHSASVKATLGERSGSSECSRGQEGSSIVSGLKSRRDSEALVADCEVVGRVGPAAVDPCRMTDCSCGSST